MEKVRRLLPDRLQHHFAFRRIVSYRKGEFAFKPFHHNDLARTPDAKYVALSLFTANLTTRPDKIANIYLMGALQNAVLMDLVYRDWNMVIYVDASSLHTYPRLYAKYFAPILQRHPKIFVVEVDWRTKIPAKVEEDLKNLLDAENAEAAAISSLRNEHGWDLARLVAAFKTDEGNIPIQYAKTVYRFFPGGYNVAFISRDLDARINLREEVAMDEWMHSTYTFSRMFDNPAHTNPMLAGMWGAKSTCHNVFRDPRVYGSCNRGDVPLPNIIQQLSDFLSDTETMMRGYGIDELFLGTVDSRIAEEYYDNVITYGKGGFYAGSVVFSMFTDRQSLKVGHRMLTLMPCAGPDDIHGSHQSDQNYVADPKTKQPILGRSCYFAGEDLPMHSEVPEEVADWIIHWTLNYSKATAESVSADALKIQFQNFGIKHDPRKFASALKHASVAEFQDKMKFDKRILPHFWYVLLSGTNANIPFIEAMGNFNPNEYEIRVFEAATRKAFLEHSDLQPALLRTIHTDDYTAVHERIVAYLNSSKNGKFLVSKVNLAPFFRSVREYVREHSRVLHLLEGDEIENYWYEVLNVYPFSSIRQMSLEF